MKKFLKITGIALLVIIVLMVTLPFIFKGKIIGIIKKEINKTLTADVDFKKVGLNLFSDFPYLAVNIQQVSVVGRETFVGDTLVAIDKLNLSVNIKSIFGDNGIEIRKISLQHPIANLLIDKEGKTNWNIVKSSGTSPEEPEATDTSGGFKLLVKDFRLSNGYIVYDDQQGAMKAIIDDLNFRLSGDLTADLVTLDALLKVEKLTYIMDGIPYLSNVVTDFKGKIEADLKNSKYTLQEADLALNALELDLAGWVAMPTDDIDMDLSMNSKKSEFKTFLSLIPGIYAKDFQDIKTQGMLTLSATATGKLTETLYPAFDINLLIENAMFKYPDLPKSVDNIQLNAHVYSKGGDLDNTIVDLSKLHLEMEGNQFDMKLLLKKPISNPTFDFVAKGILNLNAINDFYPLEESMNIAGIVNINLTAIGDMNSIDNERYEDVNIAGNLNVTNGMLKTDAVKDEITLNQLNLDFSQKYVGMITDAKIGRNDIKADGKLENFIGYILRDDEIKGALNLNSNYLNINDFMGEETTEAQPEEPSAMSVIEIPANIDFSIDLDVKQLIFEQFDLSQVSGKAIIKDQTVDLKNLSMKAMDGEMKVSGAYNAKNPQQPQLNMKVKISDVDVQKTAKAFVTMEKLLPIINNTDGTFSVDLDIETNLDNTMSPDLNSLYAKGKIASPGVKVSNIEALNKIADALKMDKLKTVSLSKFDLSFLCENGRVKTDPFDIKTGNIKATVSGSTGFDETIDYTIDTKIPRSEFGSGANDFLNNLTSNILGSGINVKLPDVLNIPIKVGGTFSKPTVNLSGIGNTGKDITKDVVEQVVEQGKEIVNEQIDKALDEAKKQKEKLIAEAQKQKENLVAQARKSGDAIVAEADKQGQELVKKAGSNPIAKKAAEEGAKKLKKEAQEKVDGMVKEAGKQGDKLVDEATKQGDDLIKTAENKKL